MGMEATEITLDWREMLFKETAAGQDGTIHYYDFPCPILSGANCDRLGTRDLFIEQGNPLCHDGKSCLVVAKR
mgnify:CR=1 FL=1